MLLRISGGGKQRGKQRSERASRVIAGAACSTCQRREDARHDIIVFNLLAVQNCQRGFLCVGICRTISIYQLLFSSGQAVFLGSSLCSGRLFAVVALLVFAAAGFFAVDAAAGFAAVVFFAAVAFAVAAGFFAAEAEVTFFTVVFSVFVAIDDSPFY